jgi:hypothetical protein|nr:MAG TPA: hypothetical protein [Caudoviricetes sp.]
MANQNFKYFLSEKSYEDLKQLWNEYASDKDGDAHIYDSVEDFAELTGEDGVELARMVFFGDVKNWSDTVYLDGYGNFRSCWNVENSPIDLDVLAEWLEDEEHEVFTEWKDGQPTFEEWLNDSYGRSDLIAMWEEYTGEDIEDFDLGALAESIEEVDGHEYIYYLKEIFE